MRKMLEEGENGRQLRSCAVRVAPAGGVLGGSDEFGAEVRLEGGGEAPFSAGFSVGVLGGRWACLGAAQV